MPIASSNTESLDYDSGAMITSSTAQTLFVSCFLSDHPQEMRLVRNVRLIFENTTGPPINTSLPSFNSGFVKLEYALTPEVGKFFITFNIFFDLSLDNTTVKSYADDIINEFLSTFNYQELPLLWESAGTYQGQRVIHKSFGYMQYTRDNVSTFLKFKPTEGFGAFIDSLLNKYVPGNATTGLTASYWLSRTESQLEWNLRVNGASSSVPWYPHDYSVVIDVNELLGDDLSKIQPSPNQQIEISIETNKTLVLTKGLTTYTTTIENIHPEGYTISNINGSDRVEVKYETLPREDIVIKMNINSSTQNQIQDDDIYRLILYVTSGICAFLITYAVLRFLFSKEKRGGGETKNYENGTTKINCL
ncbi:MAG: hypothetical protein ACPLVJ_00640 [Candidatus Bathyarchaeales archaeon]